MSDDRPTFIDLLDTLTRDTRVDFGEQVATRMGLIQQLRAAVFDLSDGKGSGGSFGSQAPLDTTAMDLLTSIEAQVEQVSRELKRYPVSTSVELTLRRWVASTREDARVSFEQRATGKGGVFMERWEGTAYQWLEAMANRITTMFAPPRLIEITDRCPRCKARYVYPVVDGREMRRSALNLLLDAESDDVVEGRCSNCDTVWPRSEVIFLANLLGKSVEALKGEEPVSRRPVWVDPRLCSFCGQSQSNPRELLRHLQGRHNTTDKDLESELARANDAA